MGDDERASIEAGVRDLIARGDLSGAATVAIRGYGAQILSYLRAVLRDDDAATEAFSIFAEGLWRGIGGFRGEASVLTWAYRVAWGAVRRVLRDPARRRMRRLDTSEASRLAGFVRDSTAPFRRTDVKDAVARLRASLAADEQTLLILRVDRGLSWHDVAQVMASDGEHVDEAALRKRFERIKTKLRQRAAEDGLLQER